MMSERAQKRERKREKNAKLSPGCWTFSPHSSMTKNTPDNEITESKLKFLMDRVPKLIKRKKNVWK